MFRLLLTDLVWPGWSSSVFLATFEDFVDRPAIGKCPDRSSLDNLRTPDHPWSCSGHGPLELPRGRVKVDAASIDSSCLGAPPSVLCRYEEGLGQDQPHPDSHGARQPALQWNNLVLSGVMMVVTVTCAR